MLTGCSFFLSAFVHNGTLGRNRRRRVRDDESTLAGGMYIQGSPQLPEPFSHTPNPDSGNAHRRRIELPLWRDAFAVILDFDADFSAGSGNANPGGGAS